MLFHEVECALVLVLPSLPGSGEVVEVSFLERRVRLRPFSALLLDVLRDTNHTAPIGVTDIPLPPSEFEDTQLAHGEWIMS